MKLICKIYFIFLLVSVAGPAAYSQIEGPDAGLYVFPDREYCVSGDTVWYKVAHNNGKDNKSNIIHVQLSGPGNKTIASVAVKSRNGWADGFIHIPDSLSSGVYFLSAFFNHHRISGGWKIMSKSLFVYNRFQERITALPVPSQQTKVKVRQSDNRKIIHTEKNTYAPREQVKADIELSKLYTSGISHAVVRAERMDDLAAETGGYFRVISAASPVPLPDFEETDGVLISGNVVEKETGKAGVNVVVLFSLLNDPQYFDYCVTDSDGNFNFFLKDAVGTGEVVLQAISEHDNEWELSLVPCRIHFAEPVMVETSYLTESQSDLIKGLTDAGFYTRLFGEAYDIGLAEFSMPLRFELPFYGKPYGRVVLSDYFDMSDFQEISRELLRGVQFRRKGNDVNIRMLNLNANEYFTSEPFRLINGIPVFRNRLFASMGSDEIDYIDYLPEDRVYGDLRFSGVLAVYLKDGSNGWMAQQNNLFRFTVPLLQPERKSSYESAKPEEENIPDFRQVYYWQLHPTHENLKAEFSLPDIKGRIKISVDGITAEGEFFNTSEIIEVL